MGFNTRGHGPGPDGGVDLIATKDPLGLDEPRIKVQVKARQGATAASDVRQLRGTLGQGEKGCSFHSAALRLKPRLRNLQM